MAWIGVVTNVGSALLANWTAGNVLNVSSAKTGTGTVSEALLVRQTDLSGVVRQVSLVSESVVDVGRKIKVQATAATTAYTAKQIGVYAKLNNGAETLLAIFQNATGIPIPAVSEYPDFVYTFFATVTMSNEGDFELTVDPDALVSQQQLAALTLDDLADTDVATPEEGDVIQFGESEWVKGKASNGNILVNSRFTVNTKEFSTATITSGVVECVDKWEYRGTSGGTVELTASGIELTPVASGYISFEQVVGNVGFLDGRTLTMSCTDNSGNIIRGTVSNFNSAADVHFYNGDTFKLYYEESDGSFRVYTTEAITISAVKLEIGEICTIANDIPPKESEEVFKCLPVDIKSPSDGDFLGYDGGAKKWKKSSDGQHKTLATPLTINGQTESTVEDALDGLNDYGDALKGNLAADEESGAKNLNSYPYDETTKSGSGITFTDNGNGTITATGTASADVQFTCHSIDLKVDNGTYKLNGCPPGGSFNSGYSIYCNWYQSPGVPSTTYKDEGAGTDVVINGSEDSADYANISIAILIKSGTALPVGGITFKPMIYDARILDPTFVPPAKTNLQLTNDKAERNDLSTIHATGSTNTTGSTIAKDTLFYLNNQLCKALTNIAVNATFTLNTNYEEVTVGGELNNKADKWTLIATATADGVKTWSQVIAELVSNFNPSEFYKYRIIRNDENAYYPMSKYSFVQVNADDTGYTSIYFRMITINTNAFYEATGTFTPTNYGSSVAASGSTLKLYKMG